MADSKMLSADFIAELVKACLVDSKILNICRQHLKYQFLENETQKKVLKYIFDYSDVNLNQIPTIGMIGQTFGTDREALKFLKTIKGVEVNAHTKEGLLNTFEDWLKKRRLAVLIQDQFITLYNTPNKQEEAMSLLATESNDIVNFKLKEQYYNTIFKDYEKRQEARSKKDKHQILSEKFPFGVHELDDLLYGGGNRGTSALICARSGVGKTTFARWSAITNARIGKRVVAFHLEGTKEEQEEAYDAAWTGTNLRDIEFGEVPYENRDKITKAKNYILATGGEIIIICPESFDSITIDEAYEIIKDIEKNVGKVDVAIFDSLELFKSKGKYGNNDSAERKRREDVANKITNISTELRVFSIATIQANDVKPDIWNNQEKVLTRSDISEYKGAIKPFSYFITLNQTIDEYKNQMMRLYCDKFRKYGSGQVIRIYQARDQSRFYDAARTVENFYTKY